MKAKITDVAQKANVSISTVSHVLNHTRFVSEETRKKVMDAVEELGYSPDASGRTFRTGKKMMIGLVVPDITNSVFAALIEDVDDVISKQGYNLVISNTRDCLKMEKQALRNLASGVVDGIVIASTSFTSGLIAICPAVYSTPLCTYPCEYGPSAFGAFSVATIFIMLFLLCYFI